MHRSTDLDIRKHALARTDGKPPPAPGIVGARISDNSFAGDSGVGTRVGMSMRGPGSKFDFNFCDNLVFKSIALVRSLTVTDTSGIVAPLLACFLTPA